MEFLKFCGPGKACGGVTESASGSMGSTLKRFRVALSIAAETVRLLNQSTGNLEIELGEN